MRVVVTGGTGLIGHELVMSLAKDGHDVVILSRNPKQKGPMPETVTFQQWDAKTPEGWAHVIDGADAVVNLAGESLVGDGFLPERWTDERKQKIVQSRVNTGNAITEAIRMVTNKPRVLIQSSAVGYYGTHPMEHEVTEDHAPGDDFLAEVCKDWEASTEPVEAMGVRRCIIRTGIVLTTEGGVLPRLALPFKLFAGGPIGSGKQPFPWIHMDDEIGAIRFLIDTPEASGPFNLAAPDVKTNAEFGRILGSVLGRPSLIPTPGFVFQQAFGEVAILLVEGQNTPPKALLDAGYEFHYADVKTALKALYSPETALVAS